MKKVFRSFVSLLLILSMIIIDVPVGSYAAGNTTVPSIRNVKLVKDDITFWGANNYCIYEIDGVQFDSRKMSAKFNAMAWRAMETGDRRRVNQRFWNLKERKEVFGDDMAIEMGKWSDDTLGWTAVRDELAKKWEERYTKELMLIYGNDYFEQTYKDLTTFEYGSDAHTILSDYSDDPLAEDFMKKYNALILDINVGKTKGYDYAVSTVLKAREMGTKAISKELIGIIVSNFMTPTMTLAGPSKATAVTTDLVTKTFDLCDQIAQISGTIQDKTVSKEAQSTSDAAAWIRELDKIIDVELQLAQHGYDEACKFREQLEADAPGILEAIRKRDKEKTADIRRYDEERDERQEKCVSAGDVGPGSIGYSSSYDPLAQAKSKLAEAEKALEEATESDDIKKLAEEKEKKKAEYDSIYEQEKNAILAKLDAWRDEIENDTKKQIENAGFELFPDDYEFDQAKMNEHGIYGDPSDWTMQDAANVDHTDYYSLDNGSYACYTPNDLSKNSPMYWGYEYIPPMGLKAWEEDLEAQDAHNNRKADRLDALGTGVPGLFQQYYSSYQPIAGAAAGLDAAYEGSELLATCNREAYEHLNRLNKIPSNPAECEWLRNYVKEYKDKGEFAIKTANSEAYKQWLSDSSVEYEKIRTDFELAHTEYLKDLQECKDIINKKIPQYVRDQKGDPNIGFIQPYNINKDLKEEISKKSNKEQYLKREADNLTELYDQFMEYRRQCDIDQKIMQKYLGQLNEISSSLVYRYEELESIDSSYGYYNGSNLYTLFEASKNATFSDEDPFWSDKVMIASGNDGMVYTLDDERAAKLGLTPDEYRYARMMPILASDFSGASVYHSDFVAAYNELKSVKGVVLRQLKQGDHTLLQKYTSSIRSAYNNCQSCYNDTFAGIGTKNAINIAKEAYWEDGIIWQLEEKARTYIPTTRIEGGGNQRLSGLNRIMSDGDTVTPDLYIQPGSSGRLLVDVIPANATERGLVFTSVDPGIATVDEDGVVTGIAEGTTTVRVVSEDAPATINYVEGSSDVINNFTVPEEFVLEFAIEVSNNAPLPAEASSLELSADKTNIGDGEIATIIADVEPQNASAIVEWSVSPSSVAQISAGYEGEWGESASGWRSYVKGLTTGTATVTAKTANGITKSIQIKVTQSPVNVLDSSGTLLYKCNDLKEAKTWVLKEWKDNPQDIGTYTVKLNSDMNLDETNEEYHEGALVYRDNYTSSDEKIFITFDLGGNTLSIKRAQYNELALYTGTTVKNGLLRVEGPEGLTVYGDVVLDSVSAPRIFASTAFKGEIFVAENAIVSELFINDYNMTSQIGNLTGNGGINCVNGSTLFADTISCTGELSLRPDSKVYVNTSAVVGSVLAFDEGSGSIARYKDAPLTITGDIKNQGSGVLYVGITDKKVSNEDLTGEGIALSEITPQTLMFMTGQKSVPSFVKLWQPESAQNKDLVLSVSEGGAYAVVKGTAPKPVVEIEKISKLVTDKKNVSIGTGKSVTIKVTAFTGDGDAVNRPQVAWT
nr:Ig-like domain-containing protein [Lachnospiraceae bacterium]